MCGCVWVCGCVCVCVCVQVLDLLSLLVAYVAVAFYVIKTLSINEVMALWRHDPKVGELFSSAKIKYLPYHYLCLLSLLRHFSSSENGRLKNLIHVTDCYCTFLFQVFVILKKQFRVFILLLCTIKVSPFLLFFLFFRCCCCFIVCVCFRYIAFNDRW